METILDIFTTLNCAIDAGAMTQEALTVALAAIVSRAHEELERGALPLDGNRDWPEKRRDLPALESLLCRPDPTLDRIGSANCQACRATRPASRALTLEEHSPRGRFVERLLAIAR